MYDNICGKGSCKGNYDIITSIFTILRHLRDWRERERGRGREGDRERGRGGEGEMERGREGEREGERGREREREGGKDDTLQ